MSFFESIFYMAWRGLAIGLIISAPMGPTGMLCIQRTLDKGRRAGFYTGVGAAISDLFYSLLTGFGLSLIEEFLERNQNIIQLAGSAVLIAFGIYLFKRNPSKGLKKPIDDHISVKKSILGGFLFTFSNPLILFLIIGLFARFNFLLPEFRIHQYFTGFIFIFLGALLWWWLITFSVDKVRNHFNIRSMWLINRIIGVIILIFALVGIITATSALVNAEETECWNQKRGYGPFANGEGESVVPSNLLTNNTADTIIFLAPAKDVDGIDFRCKIRNHRASPSKSYKITGVDGKKLKVKNPGWGFVIKNNRNETTYIDITNGEEDFDGISSSPALAVGVRMPEQSGTYSSFSDRTDIISKFKEGTQGPDPTGALNYFKVVAYEGNLTIFGGLNAPVRIADVRLPQHFRIDSVGLYLAPGASISPDEIRLSRIEFHPTALYVDELEDLERYFADSRIPMEGYWQVLDRTLEESLIRLGGDYRLALISDGAEGYSVVYLDGAGINSDKWQPGMLKATLKPSGIQGIWDVVWYDSMFRPMSHDIKAQTDINGTLTIQFPYQNSRLRLHHSTPQAMSGR